MTRRTKKKHKMSKTSEYKLWINIIGRCCNPNTPYFKNYGARGIVMHDEWRDDFMSFLSCIGLRPGRGYSLDRIDNDKGYVPGNVRWANKRAQSHNMRKNNILTHAGRSQTLTAWADEIGVVPSTLHYRLKEGGMSVAEALTTPSRGGRRKTSTKKKSTIEFVQCGASK